ncbi:MAG TPA: hypothetical protein VHM30_14315, partial [Gemmatimonadaceae bacterium]|nr:hypothetical protein [Gemmatimonadaceae bacterium]
TSVWPLLNEEASSGVTLHEMDAGADTGPVVGQRLFPIPPYMTARQLYETYMDEALMLFREWFPVLLKERPPARAQDEADASAYTRASLDLSKCEIDFDLPAQRVCSFVRAFTFPEYQLPTIAGRAVRSAAALPGVHPRPAGSRLSETPYSTVFVAGDGGLVEVIWA